MSGHVWVEDATKPLGGHWVREKGTADGTALVRARAGSGGYLYTRYHASVTTKQQFEIPTDQNIEDLYVFVKPNGTSINANIILLLGLDVEDATAADVVLGTSSVPADLDADVLWYPCEVKPGGAMTHIPINGDLAHGNIYVRSSDGTTGLDVWLGAQRRAS